MWHGFDPDLRQKLEVIKQLTALRHQTPTKEWPFVIEEADIVLVIREWPDGQVTAYTCAGNFEAPR